MDLHLRIDDDLSGIIEIDLRAGDNAASQSQLDYRWVSYDEVGGEALNVSRDGMRRALAPEAVDRLRRLLPNGPLPTPAHLPFGIDGATFTLTIGRGANAAEYAWWSYPPVEWESLRTIVGILLISAGVSTYVDQYPGLLS